LSNQNLYKQESYWPDKVTIINLQTLSVVTLTFMESLQVIQLTHAAVIVNGDYGQKYFQIS